MIPKYKRAIARPLLSSSSAIAGLGLLILLSSLALRGAPENEKQLSVYSTAANYSVNVQTQNGVDYVGVLEVLEPLGTVSTKADSKRWRLRYNNVEGEFTPGKNKARVHGKDVDLTGPFLLENSRGLVPVACLASLMPQFLGGPVTFHVSARRLFIGSVGIHFTAQVKNATPPALVMDFTSPVNPQISTEPGKLHMTFRREPLLAPGTPLLTFDSPVITSANYQESNGTAEIVINSPAPLFASFSNDGKTITVAAPQTAASTANQPGGTTGGQSAQNGPGSASAGQKVFAIVDASHGGQERGAALTDQLAEKDVTITFAHRLRQDLNGHGFATLVLRDADETLSLDERAAFVNQRHPAVYILIHASSQGSGVRLYTAALPNASDNRGPFLDWNTAQSRALLVSRSLEVNLANEYQKSQVPVRMLYAPLRPLNNVEIPALAVEVAPPPTGIQDITSTAYQSTVSSSIVNAVTAMRNTLETR